MFKDFLKNGASYGFVNFFTAALGLITFPIYTHYLGASDYGLISLISSILAALYIVCQFGITNAMQRYFFDKTLCPEKVVYNSLIISTLFSLIPTVFFLIILYFHKTLFPDITFISDNIYIITLAVSSLPFLALRDLYVEIQRNYSNIFNYSLVVIFHSVLQLALAITLLVSFKHGVNGIFEAQLFTLIAICLFCIFKLKDFYKYKIDKDILKMLLLYGAPLIIANLSSIAFNLTDKWLLTYFKNTTELALYTSGFNISKIVLFINTAVSLAWSPFVLKLYNEDSQYKSKTVKLFNLLFFLTAILSTLIIVFSKDLLSLLTPEPYWSSSSSAQLLVISALLQMTYSLFSFGIILEKKPKILSKAMFYMVLINILLNIALIPHIGHTGASIATLISYFFISTYYLYFSQKLHPMKINFYKVYFIILALIASAFVIHLIEDYKLNTIELFTYKIFTVFFVCLIIVLTRLVEIKDIILYLKNRFNDLTARN